MNLAILPVLVLVSGAIALLMWRRTPLDFTLFRRLRVRVDWVFRFGYPGLLILLMVVDAVSLGTDLDNTDAHRGAIQDLYIVELLTPPASVVVWFSLTLWLIGYRNQRYSRL